MTRVLANLLGVEQLDFRVTIQKLEQIAGKPSKDIRLATEMSRLSSEKIRELGLDPQDTTAQELYYALQERFRRDTNLVRGALSIHDGTSSIEAMKAIVSHLQKATTHGSEVLAIKNSVAKKLLKHVPPKKTMKQLGYRSLDSMLKHESAAQIQAAAMISESQSWQKKYLDQYESLSVSDFEIRPIEILLPTAARWVMFAENVQKQQITPQVLAIREQGSVVVLPMHEAMQELWLLAKITEVLNDVHSVSSFLKLQQVKADFGKRVHDIALSEPLTSTELMNKTVSWRAVHQYFSRFTERYDPLVFEPHVRASDLRWLQLEKVLEKIHPVLSFWGDGLYAAYTDKERQTVSFNVFDVAEDCRQKVLFLQRSASVMQKTLWDELIIRYLDHTNISQALAQELQTEPVFIEES